MSPLKRERVEARLPGARSAATKARRGMVKWNKHEGRNKEING
jgi:hypothetical protein